MASLFTASTLFANKRRSHEFIVAVAIASWTGSTSSRSTSRHRWCPRCLPRINWGSSNSAEIDFSQISYDESLEPFEQRRRKVHCMKQAEKNTRTHFFQRMNSGKWMKKWWSTTVYIWLIFRPKRKLHTWILQRCWRVTELIDHSTAVSCPTAYMLKQEACYLEMADTYIQIYDCIIKLN